MNRYVFEFVFLGDKINIASNLYIILISNDMSLMTINDFHWSYCVCHTLQFNNATIFSSKHQHKVFPTQFLTSKTLWNGKLIEICPILPKYTDRKIEKVGRETISSKTKPNEWIKTPHPWITNIHTKTKMKMKVATHRQKINLKWKLIDGRYFSRLNYGKNLVAYCLSQILFLYYS